MIEPLSVQESLLLAWDLPNLRQLIVGEFTGITAGTSALRRLITQARGHPMLLEIGERHADSAESLRAFNAAPASGVRYRMSKAQRRKSTALTSIPLTSRACEALDAGDDCDAAVSVRRAVLLPVLHRARGPRTGNRGGQLEGPVPLHRSARHAGKLDAIVAELAAHGLVAVSDRAGAKCYELDAEIAAAGRQAASSQLRARAIAELSAYWQGQLLSARGAEPGAATWSVMAAARRALPYATQQEQWGPVGELLDSVLCRDRSRAIAESLLQAATRAAAATRDTEHALAAQARLGLIKSLVSPEAGKDLRAGDAARRGLSGRDYRIASKSRRHGRRRQVHREPRGSGEASGAQEGHVEGRRPCPVDAAGRRPAHPADSFNMGKGIDETLREAQLLRERMEQAA